LFKSIIDPQIDTAINLEIDKIKKSFQVNAIQEQKLEAFLYEFKKTECIYNEYYVYNPKLASLKVIQFNHIIESYVSEKIKDLKLESINFIESVKAPVLKKFVDKATSIGLSNKKIELLVSEINQFKSALSNAQRLTHVDNDDFYVTLDDYDYHTSGVYQKFSKKLSELLTIKEFEDLFVDQLSGRIGIKSKVKLNELMDQYQPDISQQQKEMLQDWVRIFTTKREIAKQYYAYNTSIQKVKLQLIDFEAIRKYRNLLYKISKTKIDFKAHFTPNQKRFIANAKKKGVDSKKAMKVMIMCEEYELKQAEILVEQKYNKEHIYYLDTHNNSKKSVENDFKYELSKLVTQEEFGKLFWEQLKPDVIDRVKTKLNKAQELYNFDKVAKDDLKKMLITYITKEATAYHYYSYDKKLAKQKVKAISYKFKSDYDKKIKQLLNPNN